MAEFADSLRIDKWLHHVRVFKTRSLAAQACHKGNVRVAGRTVKPARVIQPGMTLEVKRGDLQLTLQVKACPERRLGAPRVPECLENLTPEEVYEKAAQLRQQRAYERPKGHEQVAKPNKQQLRQLRAFWEQDGA